MASTAEMLNASHDQQAVVFRTSAFFRCLAIGLFVCAIAVSTVFPVMMRWLGPSLNEAIAVGVILLCTLGFGFAAIRHLRDVVEADAAGITYRGPGARQRSLEWADVEEVRVRPKFGSLIIGRAGGRKGRIRIDHDMFPMSRALFDLLHWAWRRTRKDASANLALPRSFRASGVQPAVFLYGPPLFCGALALSAACSGEWPVAYCFLASAALVGVGFAWGFPLEYTVSTSGINIRCAIGRPRLLPLREIEAIELGYDGVPRAALSSGKRWVLGPLLGQNPFDLYEAAFQAWSDWRIAYAGEGQERPAPEPGSASSDGGVV